MNLGLIITIISLAYVALITAIYFGKKRIDLLENKIYSLSLITTIIGFTINIISFLLDIYFKNLVFVRILFIKLYYFYLLTLMFLMTLYLFVSSIKKPKKLIKISTIVYMILGLISFFLAITPYDVNNNSFWKGPNIVYIYMILIICVVIWLIYIFKNLNNLKKEKYIPMFTYSILSMISIFLEIIYPGLFLEPVIISFVLVFMYFTIENPDLKLINELELAKNNAEKSSNAKTDFLSSMSHEIRTPLNAIVGFSNSILEDNTLEEAKEEAKDIVMASNNLLEIVNGILDISKIEAGKLEMIETNYNTKELFDDIIKLIKPRIGDKSIELKINISKELPSILYGDSGKIREIIINILTNACKYTDTGWIEFRVDCKNTKNICHLIISIEDTGRGIETDKIDKLFTKFNRLEEDKNTTLEGTGLGLAITKNLVEMLNGKITVQSQYQKGSKFTVTISQKIISLTPLNEFQQPLLKNELKDYSNAKVLIVDDNNLNLKVASRILKNYNIVPDTCNSGKECLEKTKTTTYDLIFLDDMMPNMSGVETLEELQKNKDFKTPVIALTANAINGMREKYLELGFNEYLAKPINKEELERILNNQIKM